MKRIVPVLLWLLACGSPSHEHELFDMSVEAHESAIKLGEQVDRQLTTIEEKAQALDEPFRQQWLDSARVLKNDLNEWRSMLVEVPGHEHDHSDHHDHDHGPPLDLTPEMVLEIQQELKYQVEKLSHRAQNLLDILEQKE